MKALLPANEDARLKALQQYEILDTGPEQEFDDITLLASHICGTPIAMISLIDENRQWFKSKIGMTESETSRDVAFCAHGILQGGVFVVKDAQADERFASNPLVTRNPNIRFYAGSPLITEDGHALGMLCVNDQVPRELNAEQIAALQALSHQVVAQLEQRRSVIKLRQAVAQLKQTEEELRWKTAFLEAQVNSSMDGILVVNEQGKMLLQNQRMIDLWKMPQHIAEEHHDENRLRWVTNMVKNPRQFIKKVSHLYAHPGEISRDEIELKDGTILDRYSSPVTGKDGKYYGRIWKFRDITEQKRAQETLRESEEKFRQLADNITDVFWICSPDFSAIHYVSAGYEIIWGRSMESLYANPHQWIEAVLPEERERTFTTFKTLMGDAPEVSVEYQIARPDGTRRWIHDRGFQVRNHAGDLVRVAGIASDITERKRVEGHLFESQKMETVGKLAGGIAHEFNSIMTAIIGQSELLIDDLPPGSSQAKNAAEIRKASERAAILTRQLLAYGRKQMLQPAILDLNTVLAGMEHTLRHLMGRAVDVHFDFATGLKPVKADVGQIEQVVLNIVMNAADAMPNGGKLTVETANVTLDAGYVRRFPDLKAGEYVMLAIGDTGAGMGDDVKARAFEPFFTTKGVGKGTGLGLATCHGILKQSGGHIAIYSELGRGTTLKIYLPHARIEQKGEANLSSRPKALLDLPRGTERILLVEDDPSLREMAATLLERLGYTVLVATNGVEAMTLVHQQSRGHIDLLFTDVVMPQMSGNELADRIRALHPQIKILFTSAYTTNAIVLQGVLSPTAVLLQKPFTPSALAHKVRELLDGCQNLERGTAKHDKNESPEKRP